MSITTAYTTQQIRAIETYCYQTLALSESILMERAGTQAWSIIHRQFPDNNIVLLLAGVGNNAGDAYVVARLAKQAGCATTVITVNESQPHTEVARQYYQAYLDDGGKVTHFTGGLPPADLIIDGLFGIGLQRPITGDYAELIRAANQHDAPTVALDVPSGLDADSGQLLGETINATVTLTFIGKKQGMLLGGTKSVIGELHVCDLNLPHKALVAAGK